MEEALNRLARSLGARGFSLPAGVGEDALARATEVLGFPVPPWAAALYRRFDGVPLVAPEGGEPPPMAILPLSRALAWVGATVYGGPASPKLFFFAEEESDPLVQIVEGPLTGYIFRLAHDGGGATLFYRDEVELLDAIAVLIDAGGLSLDDLDPTVGADRTSERDHLAGLAASQEAALAGLDQAGRGLILEIAAELLGPQDGRLTQLLADDDVYVREKAELLLRRRKDVAAKHLLAHYAAEQKRFRDRCRSVLTQAGWVVRGDEDDDDRPITWRSVSVGEPGRRLSLNLSAFFPTRHRPDFEQALCDRVRVLKEK